MWRQVLFITISLTSSVCVFLCNILACNTRVQSTVRLHGQIGQILKTATSELHPTIATVSFQFPVEARNRDETVTKP